MRAPDCCGCRSPEAVRTAAHPAFVSTTGLTLSMTAARRNRAAPSRVDVPSRFDGEASMMALGVYCIVAGTGMAAGSLWSRRYRPVLEMMGGGLFLAGLGFAGANFALAS